MGPGLPCKQSLTGSIPVLSTNAGAVAQLGERRTGSAKVGSSILPSSTGSVGVL